MQIDFTPAWVRLQVLVNSLIRSLPNLFLSLLVLVLFFLASQWLRRFIVGVAERRYRLRHGLALVFGRTAQWLLVLIGLLISLVILIPSFEPGQLVQLLGLSSVAIGFAFRDIFQNFLAGTLILLSEPFRIEDQIIFKEWEGTVEEIHTRATTVRTYDGRRVVIPNAELFTNSVMVNTAFEQRRLEQDVIIGRSDDIEHARRVMVATLREIEDVLTDPSPEALVMELADFGIRMRVRWWIAPPVRREAVITQDRVLTALRYKLLEEGIDLPFPTQQILFHDQTEETDGDRARQREGWPARAGERYRARTIATVLAERLAADGSAAGRESKG